MKVLISTDGKIIKWLMLILKVFIKRDRLAKLERVLFNQKIMVKTCGIMSWCGYIDWFFESVSVTNGDRGSKNIRDFKIQRRGRQRERQKNNRFNKQNNNFARASHLFCTFLSRLFTTVM